ncbi:MAG TPA: sialate O-acetylesterase [Planctomycetota bacterium]|nr:sialate O-acetylesterase [Planctomycetota bacterium]
MKPLAFILAGQSNMRGSGTVSELPEHLRRLPGTVELHISESVRSQPPHFGPEIGFAHAIAPEFPGCRIVLIKHAMGGASLLDWDPDWTYERAAITEGQQMGAQYPIMIDLVREVTRGREVEFAAILWMQGERDSRFPEAARQYEANLRTLIARFRRDVGVPGVPFIFGRANPPRDERYAVQDVVLAAMDAVERTERNVAGVSTEGISKLADGLHYDSPGLIELGRRFAQAYLAVSRATPPAH